MNLMTFDYYVGTSQEMATGTETAASDLHGQLQSRYPSDRSSQIWNMIGVRPSARPPQRYEEQKILNGAGGRSAAPW